MKSIVLVLVSALSFSAVAQESTSSTAVLPEQPTSSESTISTEMPETAAPVVSAARGIRVAAWLPNVKMELGDQGEARIDRTFGVTAGYASLPVRKLGWIANVGLFEMTEYARESDSEKSSSFARLDANVAFAMNRYLYLKAGGNITGFTQSNNQENFEPGFGYQGALGMQVSEQIGFEVGWIQMAQIGTNANAGEDLKMDGLDFGIHGTF